MPPPTEEETDEKPTGFWHSEEPSYWDSYLAARPKYTAAFYERVMDYHRAGGAATALAVDVGTGPGQVAQELARRFGHVVATDVNAPHLAAARARLAAPMAAGRVSVARCGAEDLASRVGPAAVDLVAAAECMPLLDAERAVDAWAAVLRPGGTLAIWFYGRPLFVADNTSNALDGACNAAYAEIADRFFQRALAPRDAADRERVVRANTCMRSWLDSVRLDGERFCRVVRHKWNPDGEMAFSDPTMAGLLDIPEVSNVGPGETVEEEVDRGFWGERWDMGSVRRFLRANLPGQWSEAEEQEHAHLFARLEGHMGGKGATRRVTWPVVLILATRK